MPAALDGFLRFTDAEHILAQPDDAGTSEPDWAHPTTSIDLRVDVDLDALVSGRVFAGEVLSSPTLVWMLSAEGTGGVEPMFHNGATSTDAAITYFVAARKQYRVTYSGTTVTFYERDPDDGSTLDVSTGWTQVAQNTTFVDINTLSDNTTPFVLMRRFNGIGWSAADWYEFYLDYDGGVVSSWKGGDVPLNLGANTFTDVQAQTWTWEGTDPSQTPNAGVDELIASLSSTASITALSSQVHKLNASSNAVATTSVSLQLTTQLSSSIDAVASVAGSLKESENLSAALNSVATLTATLIQAHHLVASTSAVVSSSGSLTSTQALTSTVSAVASVSSSLVQTHEFTGSMSAIASITASLTTISQLGASVESVASTSASLTQTHQLIASSSAVGSISALLDVGGQNQLVAVLSVVASSSGSLSVSGTTNLVASVSAVATTESTLDVTVQLIGSAGSVASISGTVDITSQLAASLDAVSVLTADLTILAGVNLTGDISAVISVSGTLKLVHFLSGELQGVASLDVILTNTPPVTFGIVTLTTTGVGSNALSASLVGGATSSEALLGDVSLVSSGS